MAEIYTFVPKPKENPELEKLRVKLLSLYEQRENIVNEIRYTKDAIKLLEKGEKWPKMMTI